LRKEEYTPLVIDLIWYWNY